MTNEETIYRQDVLDLAKKGVLISNGSYKSVCKAINELPPAEPKTGHWIWRFGSHKCSNCEEYTCFSHKELLRYCPNCGARMVEPQERSDKG